MRLGAVPTGVFAMSSFSWLRQAVANLAGPLQQGGI